MKELIDYLKDTVGIEITVQENQLISKNKLPFHLIKGYEILPVCLQGKDVVFVKPIHSEYPTPDQLTKQLEQIEKALERQGIFIFSKIDTYARKRMVQNKTAFIIENGQTYIPFMLIDLDERKTEKDVKKTLSPSSQCIVIYHLMVDSLNGNNLQAISRLFEYTTMTITRSVKEMENFELCNVSRAKDKRIEFQSDNGKLWSIAKEFMKSPVQKKIWIDIIPRSQHLILSGISALSGYSDISDDKERSYAINKEIYRQLKHEHDLVGENRKYGNVSIEIWKYNPEILSDSGKVDPLSLYLLLSDNEDERIQQALDQMIDSLW